MKTNARKIYVRKIYVRKIFDHDITHEISVAKEIVNDYFENITDGVQFKGKKSSMLGNVTINSATDPRFGGDMKKIVEAEGDVNINDFLVISKINSRSYCLEVIHENDTKYETFSDYFSNEERHLITYCDESGQEETLEDNDLFSHTIYGIHIKKKNDALSNANPHICIGWSAMGDLSNIKSKDDILRAFESNYPDANPRTKGQNVGQIKRFVIDAKKGDYVVFADGETAHIGIIESDYYYLENPTEQDPDYVNNRKVKWIKEIPYYHLSLQLKNALGTAMSFFTLNDYKSAISDIINDKYIKDDSEEPTEQLDIYNGFETWLKSTDNPDYTGKEKYDGYPYCLKKLVKYMKDNRVIDDDNLNELDVNKFNTILEKYYQSNESKKFDAEKLQSSAGVAALKKYILYIKYLLAPNYKYSDSVGKGYNQVIYGTPGCGKSFYVMHNVLKEDDQDNPEAFNKDFVFRTTFFQDYSNTDFVGQVMPFATYEEDGGKETNTVTYKFIPGPFTLALECAIANPTEKVALVIEELNRGNAPSIFGDLFQLLDRITDENKPYPIGTSEYGITNANLCRYLSDNEHYNKKYVYNFKLDEVRIPSNLYLLATMNTSDQNVFTLDTAFKRRWNFMKIKNVFTDEHKYKDYIVPGIDGIKWEDLVIDINDFILTDSDDFASEDKQLGVYFVTKDLLCEPNSDYKNKDRVEKFAYKLFEYLWDDVAKFSRPNWFGKINSLDELIDEYKTNGVKVFVDGIVKNRKN